MRELTKKERKEYDRLVLGAKQIGLESFIGDFTPTENTEFKKKAECLSDLTFEQMSLFSQ